MGHLIEVTQDEEGWYVLKDTTQDIAVQGETYPEALRRLAEVVELERDLEQDPPEPGSARAPIPDVPWLAE